MPSHASPCGPLIIRYLNMQSSTSMPIFALICVAGVAGLPTIDTNQSSVPGVDQVRSLARRSGPRLQRRPSARAPPPPQINSTEVANNVTSPTVQPSPSDRKLTFATLPTQHEGGPALPQRMTYGFFEDVVNKITSDFECIEDVEGCVVPIVESAIEDMSEDVCEDWAKSSWKTQACAP